MTGDRVRALRRCLGEVLEGARLSTAGRFCPKLRLATDCGHEVPLSGMFCPRRLPVALRGQKLPL